MNPMQREPNEQTLTADQLLSAVPEEIHEGAWVKDAIAHLRRIAVLEQRLAADMSEVSKVESCDNGHKFVVYPDHPRKDGLRRCPYCMATGLDLARERLAAAEKELEEARKRGTYWADLYQREGRGHLDTIKRAEAAEKERDEVLEEARSKTRELADAWKSDYANMVVSRNQWMKRAEAAETALQAARERCATICDSISARYADHRDSVSGGVADVFNGGSAAASECAETIRAIKP